MRSLLLATVLVAGAAVLCGAPALAGSRGAPCRVFADIPNPGPPAAARPRMDAWAEVHCAQRTTLSVQVCARTMGAEPVTSLSAPIWCRRSRVAVPAGGRSFARTRLHACTPGTRYLSVATVDGLDSDSGPWAACRTDP